MEENFYVSSSPHIKGTESVRRIMLDVVLALIPAVVAGAVFFGIRAILVTVFSIFCCVVFEGVWQRVTNRPVAMSDFSAIVTGMLIAMNLPVGIPYWMVMIAAFFAIIIVKQLFGGLGNNFMNPALAARAFLFASWPEAMTNWVSPVDAVSTPTVLSGQLRNIPSYFDMFIGKMPGCIGEVSAAMLILGGVYLIIRRVISPVLPLTFIATVYVFTTMAGPSGFMTGDGLMHILSGGLMLGAIFMATDYVTSPITWKGKLIMGIGCGILTAVIRLYGGYPEGVSYSILLMNVATPLIDKVTAPKRFAEVAKNA